MAVRLGDAEEALTEALNIRINSLGRKHMSIATGTRNHVVFPKKEIYWPILSQLTVTWPSCSKRVQKSKRPSTTMPRPLWSWKIWFLTLNAPYLKWRASAWIWQAMMRLLVRVSEIFELWNIVDNFHSHATDPWRRGRWSRHWKSIQSSQERTR